MTTISDGWLQGVATVNRIPALRPAVVNVLIPFLELHLRSIIGQANKFTRHGKASRMTVRDLNLALTQSGAEPLYGLVTPQSNIDGEIQSTVSLVDIAKQPLPPCPLQPELSLHWLAVDGSQPQILENPRLLDTTTTEHQEQLQLPKEMRQFFYRITTILLENNTEDKTCRAVLNALRSDAGLQELLPHLSQFIQREVKANSRSLRVLKTLISATDALWENPYLSVEFHLQQMLPAAFTCVLASKLCNSPFEDHWALRTQAAKSIARVLCKFRSLFPDLHARVCRTYMDALAPDRALATVCGGIVGLTALGHNTVQSLILPQFPALITRIDETRAKSNSLAVLVAAERVSDALVKAIGSNFHEKRRLGMDGTWPSLYSAQIPADSMKRKENNDDTQKSKKRKTDISSKEKVHTCELEEKLVMFYATEAPEAAQCRMFI
jgi:transcription initiation factor TFIID subunit 6